MFWESQRTRRTQSKRRKGGPCVRVKRTSGPGAWRGMAGFARHALGKGADAPTAQHGVFRRCRRCRRYRSAADAALHNGFACRPAGALRSLFSVAVEGLALWACTLRSPGRLAAPYGAPGGVRTPDPRLRRPLLYPTELQAQKVSYRSAREAQSIQSSSSSWGKARSQRPREMRKSGSCFQPSSVV